MKFFYSFLIAFFSLSALSVAQNPNPESGGICNFAGTISQGVFVGQSSKHNLDTIILCSGDSILIEHNGDAVLSGDPVPSTAAGIFFPFYDCPPTISGDNLQAINNYPGPGDPCLRANPDPNPGFYGTKPVPNGGDTWFFNDESLQFAFNDNEPLRFFYAPMTIDDWMNKQFEKIKGSPGPCVHVNIDEAFSVLYLNQIKASQISTNFGDDCLGKFRLIGGYPQFDHTTVFDADVALKSDPNVKALIHNPDPSLFEQSSLIYSVTTPGIYTISLLDPANCGFQFDMDMSGCNSSDNLIMLVDTVSGKVGDTVCVPVRVRNFDIFSGAMSFSWDPALLSYVDVSNLHPAIADFFEPSTFLNTDKVDMGMLGVVLLNTISIGAPITIPDDQILFNLCFVPGNAAGTCAAIDIGPNPAQIAFETTSGAKLAVTKFAGEVCIEQSSGTQEIPLSLDKLSPNPVKAGDLLRLDLFAKKNLEVNLRLLNEQGKTVRELHEKLNSGSNQLEIATNLLSPGVYFIEIVDQNNHRFSTCKLLVY